MPSRALLFFSCPLLGAALVTLAMIAPSGPLAIPREILVPAYFYPTADDSWGRLNDAARRVPLTAILNPASGPGVVADPNYIAATDGLRAAGGGVVAYVSTAYGTRSIAAVEADIVKYLCFYQIDGFFIDEMANDPAHLTYYKDIYSFVKFYSRSYRVIGNPGTNTIESYLISPTADTLVTFEGAGVSYADASPLPYNRRHPADRLACIIHGVATSDGMLDDLASAAGRNVGSVYITDNSDPANPYGRLPAYFEQEVASVRVASATHEPHPGAMLSMGIVALAVNRRFRMSLGRFFRGDRSDG